MKIIAFVVTGTLLFTPHQVEAPIEVEQVNAFAGMTDEQKKQIGLMASAALEIGGSS